MFRAEKYRIHIRWKQRVFGSVKAIVAMFQLHCETVKTIKTLCLLHCETMKSPNYIGKTSQSCVKFVGGGCEAHARMVRKVLVLF